MSINADSNFTVGRFAGVTAINGASNVAYGLDLNGTLNIGSGGTTGSLNGDIRIQRGSPGDAPSVGTLIFNRADASSYSGSLTGAINLSKRGGGTLSLGSQSGFSGNVMVDEGELISSNWNVGAVSIAAGSKLTTSGRIGALDVGGLLSAAAGVGTLQVDKATFAGGSRYAWEMSDVNGGAGIGYDLLTATSNLTFTGSAGDKITIALSSLGADGYSGLNAGFDGGVNHHFVLMTSLGDIVGFAQDAFAIDASNFLYGGNHNGSWSLVANGKELDLEYTAGLPASGDVPEPGSLTIFLTGLGMLGLVARRRYATRKVT